MTIKTTCLWLILIAALISLPVFAQEKVRFNSISMVGLAAGETGNSALIQTMNGISFKNWFAGIGLGIDYYKNKTIPLFLDLRVPIAKTNFFVFLDPGYNFPSKNKPDEKVSFYNTYHFFGGFYSELGIGYKMKIARKSCLLFSSGFSYKELNIKTGVGNPCLVGPCPVDYSTYEYSYSRILLKAGVRL
ncbi:MAG: hypothetical protein ABJA71_11725 [Ginsengibacter sp.]